MEAGRQEAVTIAEAGDGGLWSARCRGVMSRYTEQVKAAGSLIEKWDGEAGFGIQPEHVVERRQKEAFGDCQEFPRVLEVRGDKGTPVHCWWEHILAQP